MCVADKELEDFSDIDKHCEGEVELYFSDCKIGQIKDGVECTLENGMFKVSGLRHSRVC
ncbi:MAG: hypothetical protein ACOCZ6_04235 [Nanoarchaeota archaeon]